VDGPFDETSQFRRLEPYVRVFAEASSSSSFRRNSESSNSNNNNPTLHCVAAIARHCPTKWVLGAIRVWSDQVSQVNEDGMLPLHIACAGCCRYDLRQQEKHEHRHDEEALLDALLTAYPDAAGQESRRDGRLPLHSALDRCASFSFVQRLVQQYAGALWIPDPCTHLHCFLLAAAAMQPKLDIVYFLLRSDPAVLTATCKNDD